MPWDIRSRRHLVSICLRGQSKPASLETWTRGRCSAPIAAPPCPPNRRNDLDLDIYQAAKLLVDQHGEDAPIRAAERADELLETGDFEGAAIWRSVLAAIEEMQRGRLDGEPLN
jgi:hypothetical protein